MVQKISPAVEQLIQARMATGRYGSEEELLVEALHSLDDRESELQAMEEGLASVDRGEAGTPLDVAIQQLRQRHPIQG